MSASVPRRLHPTRSSSRRIARRTDDQIRAAHRRQKIMKRSRKIFFALCYSTLSLFFSLPHAADNALVPEAASRTTLAKGTQNATAQRFMAVTANQHATDAAVAMLKRGGSAVDAMIATQLVLGLVEP